MSNRRKVHLLLTLKVFRELTLFKGHFSNSYHSSLLGGLCGRWGGLVWGMGKASKEIREKLF